MISTASERFVEDYLLVMENDEQAYLALQDTVRQSDDINELVAALRMEWDELIDQLATLADNEWSEGSPAGLLVRQIMGGWGDSEWFAIAKHLKGEEEIQNV